MQAVFVTWFLYVCQLNVVLFTFEEGGGRGRSEAIGDSRWLFRYAIRIRIHRHAMRYPNYGCPTASSSG